MKIDLHVHTSPLSPDSRMSADEAIETAKEVGLDGICFTEHDRAWDAGEIGRLREKHAFPVFRGVEVMLQGGVEILVFGLNMDFATLLQPALLRAMVTEAKGFMVYAHPFRGLPEAAAGDLEAALPMALGKVDITSIDAVEALNGHNKDFHNRPAVEMAARYHLKTTGGSDAHSPAEIGTCVTVFDRDIATEADLVRELRAGRFTSAALRVRERWVWKGEPGP